jgi:pimeloyl-ACP methyl ester carboxylesterase
VLSQWIEHGYAVARTDYQGLGTAGPHAYLTGIPEARAVADIALASRELVPGIGKQWFAAGHSQGGGAAIFASASGQAWAPSMTLLGVIDLASGSHVMEGVAATRPAPNSGGLYPFLIRGVEATAPLDEPAILTPRALAMIPDADSKCRDALNQPDSFGGMSGRDIFRDDADLTTFYSVLHDNDPASQHPAVPVFIGQGTHDTTCPEPLTDALAATLIAEGADVTYKVYPEADHRGVISASFPDALQFAAALLSPTG